MGNARPVGGETAPAPASNSPVQTFYGYVPRRRGRVRRLCDDMPSRNVTEMIANGMVIDEDWLERGDPESHSVPQIEIVSEGEVADQVQSLNDDDLDEMAEGEIVGSVIDDVLPAPLAFPSESRSNDVSPGPPDVFVVSEQESQPGWVALPSASEDAI